MKFIIKKSDIIEDLKIVSTIANKKSNFYNIKNFLLEVSKEKEEIFIYSSNIDVTFEKSITAKVEEGGSFYLNATQVFEVIKEMEDEEITFSSSNEQWLIIEGGNSELKIALLEKMEYDKISIQEETKITELNATIFSKSLKKVNDFVSNDPIKKHLQGINIIFSDNKIAFYSSDSFVACKYLIENDSHQENCKFVIPIRNAAEIFSYLENKKNISIFYEEDGFLILKEEKSLLKLKLLDSHLSFPNLDKFFIEEEDSRVFSFYSSVLSKELKILNIILDDFSSVMKISLDKQEMKIESEPMQTGQSKHVINCNYQGDFFSIGVNIKHMQKIVANMEEFFKQIIVVFKNKYLIFKGEEKDYKIVIMPIDINF